MVMNKLVGSWSRCVVDYEGEQSTLVWFSEVLIARGDKGLVDPGLLVTRIRILLSFY